ncbi:hypothetical protein EFK50_18410 [Nocardioides marmoriginsengisoli]|uniref:Uncharacterized protein n=2 Tax=Nocardioides marmoriginsengisoli TaxID=661483 RepID=A0A3N0CCZ8_9ACTN|nr:hypothetical protein EFK50_18410 [Nocardioides marmoriginsengisoli]
MGAATFINPSAAVADEPKAPSLSAPLSTCANPPDDPDATTANAERFVDLWLPRIKNKDWLDAFIAKKTVPDDVKAEGFHAMSGPVQMWLSSCLLQGMLKVADETVSVKKTNEYLAGLSTIIFGKAQLAKMKEELNSNAKPDTTKTLPLKKDQTAEALKDMVEDTSSEPSLTTAQLPKADVTVPSTTTSKDLTGQVTPKLQKLMDAPDVVPTTSEAQEAQAPSLVPTGLEPNPITQIPLVPLVLKAVNEVLKLVAQIQGLLFTLPVVNILASAFYKICAESATMPLSCSISLPIGVPIPADVTGDNVPDVLGALFPVTNLVDVGAKFQVTRLHSAPLPAHVFAVYDTPLVKKRVEIGFDGRASSLAWNQGALFSVKNVFKALTGDVQVGAVVTAAQPGATEALTFAVKDLVGGSIGVPPSEENPMGGSIQMNPFPEKFTVNARLTHTAAKDQDTFNVESTTPTRVDAIIDQRTTTTTPKSNRRFTATVDKLPNSVTVDLVRNGEKQSIDYTGSAPIDLVRASDTAIPDVSHPDSFTESIYEVKGVPTKVHVDLTGGEDILYTANAKVPEVSFSTTTKEDGDLKQRITAKAHQIPKSVHVLNNMTPDQTALTYDADSNLADVEFTMFDRDNDKTDIRAKATDIPTHMEFSQVKATGVFDFSANAGIGLIEATLTQNDGLLLPMPGQDHATVYKRGNKLGADFRLTGFKSAHFDGSEDTTVALGLSPGGQTFDAVADMDDELPNGMNVLATAHIGALPANMQVTFDPDNGAATYAASSVIPLLEASFTDRATQMFGNAKLIDLPKNIGLTFNTTGEVPAVTYDADSRLGSIEVNYSEKPGGLAIHGLISDLPKYMKIGGIDPIEFDARNSSAGAKGESFLGQVFFQYATDGVFASPPTSDDHVYLDTDEVDSTHAELQYTGLKYLGVDTSNEELHAKIQNTSPRLLRAYLTTPNLSLTGFIDKVPATIELAQVGNLVSYDASSSIDEISTNLERANGDAVAVQIKDVPSSIDLLFDGAASKLVWDSSSPTGLVSAAAHLTPDTIGGTRNFDAGLTITDIPVHWDASWANGNVLFQAPAPGIGSIAAQVTNHGTYHVLSGDHLSAFYDQPSGDLDASLKISNLRKAGFTKLTNANGGGFVADLNMGNQGDFKFAADVTLTASKLKATGEFNHLPSTINLKSDGGRITYDGNSNPDLTVSVEAGTAAALAATPTPPLVHGVSVRDGASGSDKAVKAKLYLTGLPNHLDLNSPAGTYQVDGYHPTNGTLTVDAKLNALAPQPLTLLLTQGVPTATPVNFKFGPFLSSTAGDGTHNLSLNYTANQELGALDAEVTYGNTDDARLQISSIPASIAVNAGFGADTKTVGITMSQGIDQIVASYKHVGETDLAARVQLDDVPSAVNINIGKDSGSGDGADVDAPVFTMNTSAPGMDISAYATAAITSPVDANAAVSLGVTNLGSTVTGDLTGNVLHITSAPATEAFSLQAAGRVQKTIDLGFDGGIFQNTGTLGADLKINKVTVGLNDFSDVNLRLGFTTGLDGTFSSFTFGQESNLTIDIEDHFSVYIDWPDPFGSDTIDLITIPHQVIPLGNVVPKWHINSNTFGEMFDIPFFFFLIGECNVQFDARPAPGFTTAGSTFTLPAPPDDGSHTPAWLLTPDIHLLGLSIPDFGLDIIAFFMSPYGKGINAHPECELYDLNPF